MKKISVLVATVIVAMGITSCGDSHKSASLKTAADSVSYAIGISTGAGYKENLKTLPGDPANVDDLIAGFIQAIKGDSSAMKMTPQAAQAYVQTYFMEASARDAKKTTLVLYWTELNSTARWIVAVNRQSSRLAA